MTGPEADENERSLHPGPERDQMVPDVTRTSSIAGTTDISA
jgi:hypothetical protein